VEKYCNSCQKYLEVDKFSSTEIRMNSDYPWCKKCCKDRRLVSLDKSKDVEDRICLKCDKVRKMGPKEWVCALCKEINKGYRSDGNFETVY